MRNLLEQARAHRAQGIGGPARVGEPMRVVVPPSAVHLAASGPEGEPLEVAQRGGLAVIADVTRAGFYRVTWQGPQAGATLTPANLTSAAESDLSAPSRLVEHDELTEVTVTAAVTTAADGHQEHAWLLALAALALVVFDAWYFTRDPRAASPVAGPAMARPRAGRRGA